jgi:hypothetical protein
MIASWNRACVLTLLPGALLADGDGRFSPWRVESPGPDTLQSIALVLTPEQRLPSPTTLQYEIGFSTYEVAGIGFLYDSLTLSVSSVDQSRGSLLVTADVFGLTVAPLAPGGFLSGGGIRVEEIDPTPGGPGSPAISFGYRIEVSLPPSLWASDLRTTFDFFNNGDAVISRAEARVIAVPEPSLRTLAAVGAVLIGLGMRGRRLLN